MALAHRRSRMACVRCDRGDLASRRCASPRVGGARGACGCCRHSWCLRRHRCQGVWTISRGVSWDRPAHGLDQRHSAALVEVFLGTIRRPVSGILGRPSVAGGHVDGRRHEPPEPKPGSEAPKWPRTPDSLNACPCLPAFFACRWSLLSASQWVLPSRCGYRIGSALRSPSLRSSTDHGLPGPATTTVFGKTLSPSRSSPEDPSSADRARHQRQKSALICWDRQR